MYVFWSLANSKFYQLSSPSDRTCAYLVGHWFLTVKLNNRWLVYLNRTPSGGESLCQETIRKVKMVELRRSTKQEPEEPLDSYVCSPVSQIVKKELHCNATCEWP